MIEVVRGGVQTTVQDLGRPGYRSCGVPAGGAFDAWAARAANRLVGNPDGAAVLEIALYGPELRFHAASAVALVGDPFELTLDGRPAESGRTLRVEAGARLAVGGARRGARAWLAVAGGIGVAPRLGSRSTELAAGFGGLEGRRLVAGGRLPAGAPAPPSRPLRLAPGFATVLAVPVLRVLRGPDDGRIPGAGAAALAREPFLVAARSDRRGVRLAGRALPPFAAEELRSQGVLGGAVQATPSGEPIVLGVDAPVTGGYPWIAQVIEADLGRLAHLAPGQSVRFELVDFEGAEDALRERERELAAAVEAA